MRTLEPDEPEGMNMTPMIDVTFQLIIFFMLVTDMSTRQVEKVRLPGASQAVVTKDVPLVVNVRRDGTVAVDGRVRFRPGQSETGGLEELFRGHRDAARPVLIRADRSAPWESVQAVMTVAAATGATLRVDMGAVQERANPKNSPRKH